MLQCLPQLKRDGMEVMNAFALELLYNESSSMRASSMLSLMKTVPEIMRRLTEEPESVRKDFEELKGHCTSLFLYYCCCCCYYFSCVLARIANECSFKVTRPGAMRIGVSGNILKIPNPGRVLAQSFKHVPVCCFSVVVRRIVSFIDVVNP